jgi:site-specific DNA recombinase
MTQRAAIYVRQSLDVPEGIERQLLLTRELAARRGWSVVVEYVDNETSATKARGAKTGWARMIKAAKAGEFTHVIAVNGDRLMRGLSDLLILIDLHLKIVTVDGEIDLSSPEGEANASMGAVFARLEVRRKAERMERAVNTKIASGIPMTAMRPFGYEPDMITLRPSEAAPLAEAIERVTKGNSVHSIARWLNESEVLTTRGHQWSTTQLKKVLLRERNAGRLVRHGVIVEPSQIQPVVDAATFDLAKAILTASGRGVTAGPKPDINWLSGLMKCSVCGATILQKTKTGVGRTYSCSAAISGTLPRGERHVSIMADIAEAKVKAEVLEWADQDFPDRPDNSVELRQIEMELAELAGDRARATEMGMQKNADQSLVNRRLDEIAAEIEAVTTRRAAVLVTGQTLPVLPALEDAQSATTSSGATAYTFTRAQLWWARSSIEQRRAVIRDGFDIKVLAGGKGAKRVQVTAR